ncbi:MAG: deoxyribonuclease IV [Chloroflexi bacterium HGW-Chloroflexi-1]|nr:MAG: deoxyribonuclease IV [Chloroflexi bacterium HGW-Chloroflexi-1]
MLLGAHMSVAGGVSQAFERAASIGINTMQVFTKNQNRWEQKSTPRKELDRWFARQVETGIGPVVSHAAYLINLGSPNDALWKKSADALADELTRAEQLGILGVVLHPGAHMRAGEEAGIARIVAGLDRAHAATPGYQTLTLIENTAGQGSVLGYTFEQLRAMLEGVADPARIGFCFDTCHAFAAGYDIRTPETCAETMAAFDRLLGLARLKCFHFDDSKKGLGSRVDRHDHIGAGLLGLAAFGFILNDARFAGVPKILETPKSEDMHEDVENLKVLRGLIEG